MKLLSMDDLTKLRWVPLDPDQLLPGLLGLADYQVGWFFRLYLASLRSTPCGYLDARVALWRVAGASTESFFNQKSAAILSAFERGTIDGREYLYHPQLLTLLVEQSAKLHRKRRRSGISTGPTDSTTGEQLSFSLLSEGENKERLSEEVSLEVLRNAVNELFRYYCDLFRRDSRYTLTDSRRQVCESRLQECMRENGGDWASARDTARTAIFNLSRSDFHLNHGHFDWTDQIFKTREVFEKRVGMKIVAKPLQPGTRAGAFAHPSPAPTHPLPDWFSDVASKIEAERQTLLSQLQRERDPVKSA